MSTLNLNIEDNKVLVKQDQFPVTFTGGTVQLNSVGDGVPIYSGVVSQTSNIRSIKAGTGTEVVLSGDTIVINVDNVNLDSKLDTVVFNAYTGTTQTVLQGKLDTSYSGHTHSYNNIVDKPDLSIYSQTDHVHSQYSPTAHNHNGVYAPALGADENYVTDVEKTKLSNLSGTNTGNQVADGITITGTGTVADPFTAVGGGAGDVVGNGTSVDGNIPVYDGLSGKVITDSGSKLSDFSLTGHTHDYQNLTNKPDLTIYSQVGHAHSYTDITDKPDLTVYNTKQDFNTHTGDTTTHYTQAEIAIEQSQVQGLIDVLSSKLDTSFTGHTHNSLSTPNGLSAFVYTDNANVLHIDGDIVQSGSSYTTHAEELYTTKDKIIVRDGAVAGLSTGEFAGVIAKKYDGVNDGQLVFDNTGTARVGDVGSEQPLATRIETPTDNHFSYWDAAQLRLDFKEIEIADVSGLTTSISDLNSAVNSKLPLQSITDTKSLTGFIAGDGIAVSYSHSNRTVTLTGDLSYMWRGVKYELTSAFTSTAHAATTGSWYLAVADATNTPVWSQTPWTFDHVMIAYVNYQVLAVNSFCIKETHNTMDWRSHEELHSQIGTYKVSGGNATSGTYAENTPSDAGNSMGWDAAVVKDEDLLTSVPAWSDGLYTTMTVNGNQSVFNTTSALPFTATANTYIQVNNVNTGAMTAGINGRWYNVYQILMPVASDVDSQKYRVVMLQPQQTFTSLAAAQAEDVRTLSLGGLSIISPEFVINGRVTYQTSAGDNNTGKCRISTGGITYNIGSKSSQINVVGFTTNNHQALSNLTFSESAHIGAADTLAAFNSGGVAEELPKATFSLSGHTHTGVYAPAQDLTDHVGDSTVHFTQASISITESQVQGLVDDLAGKASTVHTHSGMVGETTTQTLTNKRITKRTATVTSSAEPAINTDNVDMFLITAQALDITSFTTNLTGTPTEGQLLWIAITGTAARAITWGSGFASTTVELPTTTVTTQRLNVGFVWNTTTNKWECVAKA